MRPRRTFCAWRVGSAPPFCLRKPFAADQLIAAIEACLDRRLEDPGRDELMMATGELVGAEPEWRPTKA